MLHALLKRKLRVIESTLDYRDVEDHLTAAVLARISYLSQKSASRLIEESIVEQRYGNNDAPRSGAGLDEVWVDFWPRYADPTSSQNIVEPDAILKVGNRVYVVEAKRSDDWGQSPEQAARDWLSYYLDDEEDEGLDGDAGTLLLLGGVPDNDRFASLAIAVHHIIAENKQASIWAEADTGFSKLCEETARGEPDSTKLAAPESCETRLNLWHCVVEDSPKTKDSQIFWSKLWDEEWPEAPVFALEVDGTKLNGGMNNYPLSAFRDVVDLDKRLDELRRRIGGTT